MNSVTSKRSTLFTLGLGSFLGLFALCFYFQTISFSFVNWDDNLYVYANPSIVRADSIQDWKKRWFPKHLGYPTPLTLLTYHFDYQRTLQKIKNKTFQPANGMEMGKIFHQTHIVLFAITVFLLFGVLFLLSKERWLAAIGTLLFVLHPVIVEPVAWITGRKEILVLLFSLLCFGSWILFSRNRRLFWAFVSLLSFGCALMSKPSAVFLFPLCFCYSVWLDGLAFYKRASLLFLLFLQMMGACVVVLWSMQWQVSLQAVVQHLTFSDRLIRFFWSLGFHAKLILLPYAYSAKYVVDPNLTMDVTFWGGCCLMALVVLVLVEKKWRNTLLPLGILFCFLSYLPSSNIIPLARHLADSYVFLPMVGVSILCVGILQEGRKASAPIWSGLLVVLFVMFVFLGQKSWAQQKTWKNSITLWENALKYNPRSMNVCRMVGHAYNMENRHAEAASVYLKCLKTFPAKHLLKNLCVSLFKSRQYEKAKKYLYQLHLYNPPIAQKYLFFIQQIEKQALQKKK